MLLMLLFQNESSIRRLSNGISGQYYFLQFRIFWQQLSRKLSLIRLFSLNNKELGDEMIEIKRIIWIQDICVISCVDLEMIFIMVNINIYWLFSMCQVFVLILCIHTYIYTHIYSNYHYSYRILNRFLPWPLRRWYYVFLLFSFPGLGFSNGKRGQCTLAHLERLLRIPRRQDTWSWFWHEVLENQGWSLLPDVSHSLRTSNHGGPQ